MWVSGGALKIEKCAWKMINVRLCDLVREIFHVVVMISELNWVDDLHGFVDFRLHFKLLRAFVLRVNVLKISYLSLVMFSTIVLQEFYLYSFNFDILELCLTKHNLHLFQML